MQEEKLLTLAMSETTKNNFVVLAFLYSNRTIIELELNENNFKDKNKNIIWDIGAITKVEKLLNKNKRYQVSGDSVLDRYLSKEELKDLIDKESINYSIFLRNSNFNYGIIKIKYIESLRNIKEKLKVKSYLEFWSEGIKKKYLVKDFRWLNYWEYKLIEKGIDSKELEERENHYRKFFNNQEVYLILYRYKNFNNNDYKQKFSGEVYWIAAVHYF